jgi:hypothetical protein
MPCAIIMQTTSLTLVGLNLISLAEFMEEFIFRNLF